MPRLVFTPRLRRFLDASELPCSASTLRDAPQWLQAGNPRLAAYLLDEQGQLRPNVMVVVVVVVVVDGRRCTERVLLADVLAPDSTVYLRQALSGG